MNAVRPLNAPLMKACAALALLALASCGGGDNSTTTLPPAGAVSGTAVKGPVSGATVTAYAIEHGMLGPQIARASTDAQGNFMLSTGAYSGAAMLQMKGGSYIDEARGTVMTMAAVDMISAVLPSLAAGQTITGIQLTPLTSMAQAMAKNMPGGMSDANIATANTAVGNYFAVGDILHTMPMNPLLTGSAGSATQDMRNYGMTLAAMSQYAKTIGMPNSSGIVTAMMNDASDGFMDGTMSGTAITLPMGGMMGGGMMSPSAGTSGLATAMTNFMNSSSNASGLTTADMIELMQRLGMASGHMR